MTDDTGFRRIDADTIEVHGLRFRGRRYVDAFPFAHNVDLDDLEPGEVRVIRAMPRAANLSVHLANEHCSEYGSHGQEEAVVRHLLAHLYGEFRDGAEHWHTREGGPR